MLLQEICDMGIWDLASDTKTTGLPKTIRFCKVCEKETPHQLREGSGLVAKICIPCMERALHYELDRD